MTPVRYVFLLPGFLTAIVATGLIVIGLRSRARVAGLLLAGFCGGILCIATMGIAGRLMSDGDAFVRIARAGQAGFQFALAFGIHLIHHVLGLSRGRWVYRALYVGAAIMVPITIFTDWVMVSAFVSPSGLVTVPGPGIYVFAGLALAGGAVYLTLLARPQQSLRYQAGLLFGLLGILLLCFADILASARLIPFPGSVFCFAPLAVAGYSLLHYDVSEAGRQAMQRGVAHDVALGVLLLGLALAATALPEIYAGQSAADVLHRFFPNALPAALSALVSFGIAFLALAKGDATMDTLLFGIFCALWGLYGADLAIVASVADPGVAIWVSRVDHLALVINVPLSFHLCLTISRATVPRWLVPLAYALGLVTAPFVFTSWYIPKVHSYWFGYFAASGPIMTVYLVVTVPFVAYGIHRLGRAMRDHAESRVRNLSRYTFYGMLGAFILAVGNIPPALGVPLYPPAHFLFVPFVLMAYGVLVTRAIQFRAFLRLAIARAALAFVLSAVFAVGLVVVLQYTTGYRLWVSVLVLALLSALALDPLQRYLHALIESLVGGEPDPAAGRASLPFERLCRRLSRSRSPQDQCRYIAAEIARKLEADGVLVVVGDETGARLSGLLQRGGKTQTVHLWADDPLLTLVRERTSENSRPGSPGLDQGKLYDLLPEARLVAPITSGGHMHGMVGVGRFAAGGPPGDRAASDWLYALCHQVAPYVQLAVTSAKLEQVLARRARERRRARASGELGDGESAADERAR